jgi:outer membrane immunogenic protein
MKTAIKFILSIAAFCAVASGAQADDWNGFYLGVNGGVAQGSSKAHATVAYTGTGYFDASSTTAIDALGPNALTNTGFTGGVTAGYNEQVGTFVWGVEGDFGSLDLNDSHSGTGIYPCCSPVTFTVVQKVQTDWALTGRLRAGWLMGDTLFYGTGGLVASDIKYNENFSDGFGETEATAKSDTKLGWALGAGVEFPFIVPGLTLKGEYLYYDLGSMTATSSELDPWTDTVSNIHANVFRVGLNWHF